MADEEAPPGKDESMSLSAIGRAPERLARAASVVVALSLALPGCSATAPLPPRAARLNEDGATALAAGDLATAEARLALALEYSPRFTEAWVNLGIVEMRRGNLEAAKRDFVRARDLNPDLPSPHHALGVLADRRGHGAESERHYRAALAVDPGFAPARANLGRRLFERAAFDEAREQFLRLTEIDPSRVEGWAGLGETLLQLGRDAEADEAIDRAHDRFADAAEVTLLVARQMMRRGSFEGAERALASLTTDVQASRRAAAWAWIAVARLALDAAAASDAADEALAIDHDQPVATYAKAAALLARGERDDAATWLARARKLSPRSDAARALEAPR
jgi:tetratricopeptide (TPR) repeat protein